MEEAHPERKNVCDQTCIVVPLDHSQMKIATETAWILFVAAVVVVVVVAAGAAFAAAVVVAAVFVVLVALAHQKSKRVLMRFCVAVLSFATKYNLRRMNAEEKERQSRKARKKQ